MNINFTFKKNYKTNLLQLRLRIVPGSIHESVCWNRTQSLYPDSSPSLWWGKTWRGRKLGGRERSCFWTQSSHFRSPWWVSVGFSRRCCAFCCSSVGGAGGGGGRRPGAIAANPLWDEPAGRPLQRSLSSSRLTWRDCSICGRPDVPMSLALDPIWGLSISPANLQKPCTHPCVRKRCWSVTTRGK